MTAPWNAKFESDDPVYEAERTALVLMAGKIMDAALDIICTYRDIPGNSGSRVQLPEVATCIAEVLDWFFDFESGQYLSQVTAEMLRGRRAA